MNYLLQLCVSYIQLHQPGVPIPATASAYNKASPMVPEGICILKFFVIVAPITAKVSASGSSPPLSMDLE